MIVWEILVGLASIPKLLLRIDQYMTDQKKDRDRLWTALSLQVEKRLDSATTPGEIDEVSKEINKLIRDS